MPRATPPEGLEIFELNDGVTAPAGNRHEVTCPYRVLADSEVAGVLGFPLPVRPWRSRRAALPVFLPQSVPRDATL